MRGVEVREVREVREGVKRARVAARIIVEQRTKRSSPYPLP
jgi:hypothetical protein